VPFGLTLVIVILCRLATTQGFPSRPDFADTDERCPTENRAFQTRTLANVAGFSHVAYRRHFKWSAATGEEWRHACITSTLLLLMLNGRSKQALTWHLSWRFDAFILPKSVGTNFK